MRSATCSRSARAALFARGSAPGAGQGRPRAEASARSGGPGRQGLDPCGPSYRLEVNLPAIPRQGVLQEGATGLDRSLGHRSPLPAVPPEMAVSRSLSEWRDLDLGIAP